MEEQLTKRERKALKKQEQEEHRRRESEERRAKKTRTWTIVIISTIVVVGFLGWLVNNAPPKEGLYDDTPSQINPITDADHIMGASEEAAKVTIVEYSDFQCPACGQYYPILKQLMDQHGDIIRFVYRHLPLQTLHPNATLAARYAEAASLQGKFFEMHDLLFENQNVWSGQSSSAAENTFKGYAESIGIDAQQLQTDAGSDAVKAKVEANRIDAIGAGAKGTPSFYVDGELLDHNPQSYQEFETFVLQKAGETPTDTAPPTLEGSADTVN